MVELTAAGRHPSLRSGGSARVRFIKSAQRSGFSLDGSGIAEARGWIALHRGPAQAERNWYCASAWPTRAASKSCCRITMRSAAAPPRRSALSADPCPTGGVTMELMKVAILFAVTAVAEIVGCHFPGSSSSRTSRCNAGTGCLVARAVCVAC